VSGLTAGHVLKALSATTYGFAAITWYEITGKPSVFTPAAHGHPWGEITGKPSTFTPSAHNHGTGTTNYITMFTNGATGAIGNSQLSQNTDGVIASKGFASTDYLQSMGPLYIRSHIYLINKAGNAWLDFATRDVSGSEAVVDLSNVRNIIPAGGALGIGGRVKISRRNLKSQTFTYTVNGSYIIDLNNYYDVNLFIINSTANWVSIGFKNATVGDEIHVNIKGYGAVAYQRDPNSGNAWREFPNDPIKLDEFFYKLICTGTDNYYGQTINTWIIGS
jgi:hypothetical protein